MRKKEKIRRKDLEYGWILRASLYVNAYTVRLKNKKRYVVFAHDFNDMDYFLTRLEKKEAPIFMAPTDSDFVPYRRDLSYLHDKKGEPRKAPFWYRGRVYELVD